MGALTSKWASVILPLRKIKLRNRRNPSAIHQWLRCSLLPSTSLFIEIPQTSPPVFSLKKEKQRVADSFSQRADISVRQPLPFESFPPLQSHRSKLFPDQQRQRRSLLVTSSEEWTTLGTNPLFTPSQPSWIVMSPDRTKAKISLVSSVKACSTLMASRADVSM